MEMRDFIEKLNATKKCEIKTQRARTIFSLSLSSYIKYYVFHVHFSYLLHLHSVCVIVD